VIAFWSHVKKLPRWAIQNPLFALLYVMLFGLIVAIITPAAIRFGGPLFPVSLSGRWVEYLAWRNSVLILRSNRDNVEGSLSITVSERSVSCTLRGFALENEISLDMDAKCPWKTAQGTRSGQRKERLSLLLYWTSSSNETAPLSVTFQPSSGSLFDDMWRTFSPP
jgi:hypothetical protein